MPVSLRLPPELSKRIEKLVDAKQTNAHAFMLEAIREKLDAEEAQVEFEAEARRRLDRMKKTGKGVPANEVFEYLHARVSGAKVARPRARKLTT